MPHTEGESNGGFLLEMEGDEVESRLHYTLNQEADKEPDQLLVLLNTRLSRAADRPFWKLTPTKLRNTRLSGQQIDLCGSSRQTKTIHYHPSISSLSSYSKAL